MKTKGLQKWQKSVYSLTSVLVALVVLAALAIGLNSKKLKDTMHQQAIQYVTDVSAGVTEVADNRIENIFVNLNSLEDSLQKVSPDQVMEFLERKREMYGFLSLWVTNMEGKGYFTDGRVEDCSQLEIVQKIFQNPASVTVVEDADEIQYGLPILENGEMKGILVGIKSKESMQDILSSDSFDNKGVSCILSADGHVVVAPQEESEFSGIGQIFQEESAQDSLLSAQLKQMREEMTRGQSGKVLLKAAGREYILNYVALCVEDWFLITLMPLDVISQKTDWFVIQSFVINGAVALLLIVILVVILLIQRKHKTQLERLAFVDPITEGRNGIVFDQQAQELLQAAPERSYALISMDIKNFKLINDLFGRMAGNHVLNYVYNTLDGMMDKGTELICRGYADNYWLLLRFPGERKLTERLENMTICINAFNESISEKFFIILTKGVYVVDDKTLDLTTIQSRANVARKSVREDNPLSLAFYDEELRDKMIMEKNLTNHMRDALRNREFLVYYQPKVQLSDNSVAGAEALVRWKSPVREFVPPEEFIGIFEKNGFICELDLYVFEQVCKTIESWLQQDKPVVPISVNLSRQHLKRQNFLEQFKEIQRKYEVPSELLELEFTETIFFSGEQMLQKLIYDIHAAGFGCSLDDFGAGFSSLSLLRSMKVDVLKIDRGFFLDDSVRGKKVVETVIDLAKKLDMRTVAEGIETEEQVCYLRQVGCDMVQGYIYSKPLPLAEFEEWVSKRKIHSL